MPKRSALVVTVPAAAGPRTNGASLRADEVVRLLEDTGHVISRTTPGELRHAPRRADLAVAVSYACAGTVRELRARAPRVWMDTVDSWLLVNGSGMRAGRAAYALRAARDAWRLLTMPKPDLVTWISGADLAADRGTVRGARHLVLPGRAPAAPVAVAPGNARRVVLAGDWDYPPNRDGLEWFLTTVVPRMQLLLPDDGWHVAVYGAGAPDAQAARVQVLGYARSAEEIYRSLDVHAAPVRFGGGVKRKVLSPLLAGLPVVTTTAGSHGLRGHHLLAVHDDPMSFAAAVIGLLQAPAQVRPVPLEVLLDRDDSAAVEDWLRA